MLAEVVEHAGPRCRPLLRRESANPMISGATRVCGVIGCPVEHSLSPAMHNAAITELGLDFIYVPFRVEPADLPRAIGGMRAFGIRGLNATIPHKEAIVPLLDDVDDAARALGAVNTVWNDGGVLRGSNTDGLGFAAPLAAMGFDCGGKRALVIGAGGAARAVIYRLLKDGARVTIANRSVDRARAVAAQIGSAAGMPCAAVIDMGDAGALGAHASAADLVVNATSVGMSPRSDVPPVVPAEWLHGGQVVYDLVYRPLETSLLGAAAAAGAVTIDGVDMLVHQGAAALRWWSGADPPIDVMRQAVLEGLAHEATN